MKHIPRLPRPTKQELSRIWQTLLIGAALSALAVAFAALALLVYFN